MENFGTVPSNLGLCLRLDLDPGTDCLLSILLCVIAGKMNNVRFVWSRTEFPDCYLML